MKSLRLDDFTKYRFLSDVKYSPNGKYACFVVHNSELEENKYSSNLWLYDVEEGSYSQLTSLNNEKSYIWMDDSKHILFPSLRNPKDKEKKEKGEEFTVFYKINIHGGEALESFRIPMNVSSFKFIDKDNLIFSSIYDSTRREFYKLSDSEKDEELKKRKEEKDYEVIDEIPFWMNGSGFTNKKRNRLYAYNLAKEEIRPFSDEFTNVEAYNINKDRNKLVIMGTSFTDKMKNTDSIWVYDLLNDNLDILNPHDEFSYSYVDFMSDNTIIALGSGMKEYGINQNATFYLIDIATKKRKLLTPDFSRSTWNSVGSDVRYGGSPSLKMDEDYLYFITTEEDSSYINRLDINGNIEKVTNERGSVDHYTVNQGNVLFIGLRDTRLQELYRFTDQEELQVSNFNQWVQEDKFIITPEKMVIETEKGVNIDGWLMKPVNFDENKKYPAILNIHGGPKTVYGSVFYHEMQYWANEGYVVFFCNPRGSDGKGNAFADIRGKYGTIDYDDIMKFTDHVLNTYNFIDKEKVGVTGGSYGGFMTNWIIGHTDRFKAAASQRSISNWISKFATTDIGYYFVDDQNAATPWNDHEKLWYHSPLKYADRVKTPTLFIHSEEDYRCWLPEGIQMFTALKYHGVESKLVMFREENHELSRSGKPKHRIRRLEEITKWFDKYLKDGKE